MIDRSPRSLEYAHRLEKRRRAADRPPASADELKERAERVLSSMEEPSTEKTPPRLEAAEEMAALSSRFDPDELAARLGLEGSERLAILTRLAPSCSIQSCGSQRLWMLRADRRAAVLNRLIADGTLAEAMGRALPASDAADRMLRDVLAGTAIAIEQLGREELLALSWTIEALSGVAAPKPDMAAVQQQLARSQFLADYEVLLEKGFVGRESELASLTNFVATGGSRRSVLLLSGLGGSGKSTLLARFARDMVASGNATLVILDFDRPGIDPQDTLWLEMEMARQVGAQLPEAGQRLREAREEVRRERVEEQHGQLAFAANMLESSRGSRASLLYPIAGAVVPYGRPLLLVLDTFEEAARRDLIARVLDWLEEVGNALLGVPLRVIISGRLFESAYQELRPYLTAEVHLGDFAPEVAEQLLAKLGVAEGVARRLVSSEVLPLRPLELKLLARLITDGRAGDVDELERELKEGGAAARELFAGLVYRRVLQHVWVPDELRGAAENSGITDEVLRNLAYPGLVLRYVTPGLVHNVLVPALGMPPLSEQQAAFALDLLARHEWLAFRQRDGIWHRRDLRRSVLKPMIAENPARAQSIHRLAISYFGRAHDPESRAEAFYHRLMLMTGEPEDPDFSLEELAKLAQVFQADQVDLPPAGAALLTFALKGEVELESVRLLPPRLRHDAYHSKGAALVNGREFGTALRLYIHGDAPLAPWERTLLLLTGEWDRLRARLEQRPHPQTWQDLAEYLLPAAVSGAIELPALTSLMETVSPRSRFTGPGLSTPLHWLTVGVCLVADGARLGEGARRFLKEVLASAGERPDPVLEKSLAFLRLYAQAGKLERLPISASTIRLDPEWLAEAPEFLGRCGTVQAGAKLLFTAVRNVLGSGPQAQPTVRRLLGVVQRLDLTDYVLLDRSNPDREALLRFLELPRPEFRDPARFALLDAFRDASSHPELAEVFRQAVPFPLEDLERDAFTEAIAPDPEHALESYVELADRAGVMESLLSLALERRPDNHKVRTVRDAVQRWRLAARNTVLNNFDL